MQITTCLFADLCVCLFFVCLFVDKIDYAYSTDSSTVTYVHDICFTQICYFRPTTQPNPLKTKILDPLPTQRNPWVNPTHGQLWCTVTYDLMQNT